jgi:hypothetical protein
MIRPLLVALAIVAAGPPEKSLSIFVDPQTRDGFIDVDRGVLDSLNDIKSELRTKTRFRVVADKDQADLILEAISRGATSTNGGGTAAIPIGAITMYAPVGGSIGGTAQCTSCTTKSGSRFRNLLPHYSPRSHGSMSPRIF